ncbi:S15/NS1, RNA-binding protein [Trifolium repens]|nr:S15/NS1, RNA-binding protein [Trifolium repens]
MALLLRLKTTIPKSQPLRHLFSTTGGDGGGDGNNPTFSDSLKDLRSSLKRQPTSNKPSSTLFSSNSSQSESVSDLMSKIQSFRNRTAAPVSEGPSSPQQISFQEIYSKMQNRSGPKTSSEGSNHGTTTTTTDGGGTGGGSSLGLDAIRGSLMKLRNTNQVQTPNYRPSSPVINGTGSLPDKIFGNPLREANSKNLDFVRLYMHDELGEKLKKLRPQVKGKDWFSIAELNERLKKVREMDEIEASSKTNDDKDKIYSNIKNAISNMKSKGSDTPKIPR